MLKKLAGDAAACRARVCSIVWRCALSPASICAPAEAKTCMWSGRRSHPDDLRVCSLTGIPFHVEFAASGDEALSSAARRSAAWGAPHRRCAGALGRYRVEGLDARYAAAAAAWKPRMSRRTSGTSPSARKSARCWDLRVHQAGLLYSIEDGSIVGRIAMGKRNAKGWIGAG